MHQKSFCNNFKKILFSSKLYKQLIIMHILKFFLCMFRKKNQRQLHGILYIICQLHALKLEWLFFFFDLSIAIEIFSIYFFSSYFFPLHSATTAFFIRKHRHKDENFQRINKRKKNTPIFISWIIKIVLRGSKVIITIILDV